MLCIIFARGKSNVVDMVCMFAGCDNFNQLIICNTSKVTNMNGMFYKCYNFNQPIEFDTSNVTNMKSMFSFCSIEEKNKQLIID